MKIEVEASEFCELKKDRDQLLRENDSLTDQITKLEHGCIVGDAAFDKLEKERDWWRHQATMWATNYNYRVSRMRGAIKDSHHNSERVLADTAASNGYSLGDD